MCYTPDMKLSKAFEKFDRENPHVYRVLVRLARLWVSKTGARKLGIASLFERARWEIAMTTSDPDYKLNNNFRAFYARLMMWLEDDLTGLFELRTSEADRWAALTFKDEEPPEPQRV